jgi:hypothetical protein
LPQRLGDTSSVQNPRITRSHPVRFGLRPCERFMISNWCLTASDSAATARTPPGRASRARVTNTCEISMNSNLIERRAFTASGCFASLRYRTIFCQNYQFATHRLALPDPGCNGRHQWPRWSSWVARFGSLVSRTRRSSERARLRSVESGVPTHR